MNVHGYGIAGLSGMETWDTSGNTRSTTATKRSDSGDTVSFSEEARELLREKLSRYSAALGSSGVHESAGQSTADKSEHGQSGTAVGEESSGTTGVLGGSGSSSAVENIKKQIEALKSQLTNLASLASQENTGADSSVHSKIRTLQTQIAALEAQLAEAEQAS